MGWALCQIFYLDYFIQSSEQLFFFLLNIFYWLCYYSSNFFPFVPFHPVPPFPLAILPLSSYPWVMHISSLATSLHILFLTSLYFVPTNLCFLINLFIFIQLQLSAFSPHPSTPPQPVPPPSPTSTLPLDCVLVSFIVAPIDSSPHYPLPTPLWLLLQCS